MSPAELSSRRLVVAAAVVALLLIPTAGAAAPTTVPPGLARDAGALGDVDRQVLPALDTEPYLREDLERERQGFIGPARFAATRETGYTPATAGTWEHLGERTSLWRLRLVSPGASSLHLAFTTFELPSTARLWVHDPAGQTVHGPYTARDRSHEGRLFTPVVLGDEIEVELVVRDDEAHLVRLVVGQVNHGYRFFGDASLKGSGDQGSCNIDVVCSQGDPWGDQIAAVGHIQIPSGPFVGLCSGTMVNNTAEDGTPYFLTASHCGVDQGNDDSVVVYWNYESPACGQRSGGSLADSQTGSTLRASWCSDQVEDGCPSAGTDFTLLQLSQQPDPSFGVYYAGWDTRAAAAPGAVGIHHPAGGEKSISFQNDPMTTAPGLSTHWQVDDWEEGTTEGGSSGSGIFNSENGLVFGILTGGIASCQNRTGWDIYGKLSMSWEGNGSASSRLRDWLDPLGLGVLSFPGTYPGQSGGDCAESATALCLQQDRFRVEVDWRDQYSGNTGDGQAVPFTGETGFFWFFDSANIELVVKILDGTGLNNRFWVFYGALSDVEYTITVTDTETGTVRTYDNEPGNICGDADTSAFTPKLFRGELPVDGTVAAGMARPVDDIARLLPGGLARKVAATTCGNAFYDEGQSDSAGWFGGGQAGVSDNMFAVRVELADFGFTPGQTEITGFCAGNDIDFGGPWPNEVFVYPDVGGAPDTGNPLAQGTIYTGDGSGQYEVTLSQPVALNGDFWLVNRGDAMWAGEDFNMEFDDGPATGNSFISDSGAAGLAQPSYQDYPNGVNFVLRADLQAASGPGGGIDCGNAFYDDGTATSAAWFGGGQAGDPDNMFAVRFELAELGFSPGAVQITEFCAGNDIDFGGPWPNEVFVYPDVGGAPDTGSPLAQGTIYTGDGSGQYEVVLSQPVTLNGDFWLVSRGDPMWAGEDFNMEFDDGPATGNSFISDSGAAGLAQPSYQDYPNGVNYILRATLETATASAPDANFSFSPSSPTAGQAVQFTDTSTGAPTSWSWSFGDGGSSTQRNPTHTFASAGTYTVMLTASNAAGSDSRSRTVTVQPASSGACQSDGQTLCLLGDRFEVTVDWSDQYSGNTGTGRAVPRTDKTGMFWFFNSDNIELLVKVLDGRGVNGHYWVFYGALSDVEYWIQVRDTETGETQVYHNEPYNICGNADTSAF